MSQLSHPGSGPAPAGHDERPLCRELTHDLAPDPAGRAGDEASPTVESEVHERRLAYPACRRRSSWSGTARRTETASAGTRGTHSESVTVVYTSPLRRASETAAVVADRLGLEARELEALREIDVGDWQGLTIDEVRRRFLEDVEVGWHAGWPNGETHEELSRRVVPAHVGLAGEHPDERVLAVNHAGPVRAALASAMGLSYGDARPIIRSLGNCVAFRLAVRAGKLERVD